MKAKPPPVSGPDSVVAVRELLLVQIDAALKRLSQGRSPTDGDVHEARKSIRRARAMLQLLRPSLDADDFAICRIELRKAGRALSAPRDAKVVAETFTEMLERVDIPRRSLGAIAAELNARSSIDGIAGRRRAVKAARSSLAAARRRLARTSLDDNGWTALGTGMRSIYRRGRRLMPDKSDSASPEAMHEWRKQVKSYWHAMEVFMPVRRPPMGRAIRDARRLAGLLGEDHDLELLAVKLRAMGENDESPTGALLEALKARHKRLRRRALKVGAALYAEPPAVMETRLRRDWKKRAERVREQINRAPRGRSGPW